MCKKQKQIDIKVDELVKQLYEIEGEITDYLEYKLSYKNEYIKHTTPEFPALGSNISRFLTAEKCEALLDIDHDCIFVDFLIEIMDSNKNMHYLYQSLTSTDFHCGDLVNVIAKPIKNEKYGEALIISNKKKKSSWIPERYSKGRYESLKTGFGVIFGFIIIQTILIAFIGIIFLLICLFSNDCDEMLSTFIWFILFSNISVFILGILLISIWWFFPTKEDYDGNIHAEAIFKKLGFNSVKYVDLAKYSLFTFNKKRGVNVDYFDEEKQVNTYLLEIALREHNQKYK